MESLNFTLLLDPLGLFFISVILLISLPSAVYSLGYLKGEYSSAKKALGWFLLVLFIASMTLVVSVSNALVFLIAWELMSLVSYFLVVFDTEHEKSIQAGTIYIVMTHLGSAFLMAALMIMYKYAHTFDFFAIKNACLLMPAQVKNIVFLLFLIGFGTKAGIVPLHVWLPYAHPQAPSHISSIMSGVMIKTAIYGLIRFVIFLLGVNSWWWGGLILVLALITCLVGVIYALMDRDLKRLLAYSSVENIGIILLGVGLSMLFIAKDMPYLAIFSLIAGLYHLVNHAIFKGLLFLCAGSVYKACGTRDIEKLGGLIKKMPQTAVYFLLGAMAISALPPLNGFVSEWLTLQAFFLGAFKLTGGLKLFLGICASLLALTGGLAAACFVKAFGIVFLALPRSNYASQAKEVSLSMRVGMFFLASLTVVFGLAATFIVGWLAKVAAAATGIDISRMSFALNNLTLSLKSVKNVYLSSPLLALILAGLGFTVFIVYRLLSKEKTLVDNTWDCGYYKIGPRNEYTSTAFSKPFRIAFSFFLLPYRKTQKIRESFYHVKSFAYETYTTPVFKKYIYKPLLTWVLGSARLMRRLQPGSIHLYLTYIFLALLLLIIFMPKF
ncbi:MAG TPA: proton-conducting transporter membrane subunit [Candidatus Omnitrophota bacterium]|nr:proton-conducting transporter membrane subunit [Candidatus Omnitrophota bacterium]HPT39598.1 proton-conducting transporter membrane subunit [Candidatus Omnitrophota bacterium]